MSKRKDKISIRFVGENAESVTGSCTLIEMDGCKILLECGIYQSNNLKEDYKRNNRRLDFKPSEIDYIFLCHAHADHSLLIPRLYGSGCKARIIAPRGSRALFSVMAADSAFIMGRDAETLNKKYGLNVNPIYTAEEVHEALKYFDEYDMGETVVLSNAVSFRFVPSGHIIAAAQLELWLTERNHTSKVLYTSDIGNISVPKYYSSTFQPVQKANIVIAETTYGDIKRTVSQKDRAKDLEKIKAVVEETCLEKGRKVLIPVFSLDRAQNILTHLYDLFGADDDFDIPVLIDSPLTIRLTKLYPELLEGKDLEKLEEVLAWKNIKYVQEYVDSQAWQGKDSSMIVLAASGFMQAGRARAWAKALLPNRNDHILFVGYSSEDSLAGKIKNCKHQKTISIDGKPIPNRCGITSLHSFTSHIQYGDMLKYYSDINAEKICLVHGEFKTKCEFGKALEQEISRKNKTTRVITVNKGTTINA